MPTAARMMTHKICNGQRRSGAAAEQGRKGRSRRRLRQEPNALKQLSKSLILSLSLSDSVPAASEHRNPASQVGTGKSAAAFEPSRNRCAVRPRAPAPQDGIRSRLGRLLQRRKQALHTMSQVSSRHLTLFPPPSWVAGNPASAFLDSDTGC